MQCDVDPDVIREITDTRPVQLAVPGSSGFPVLENLARDPSFSGLVICELLPGLVSNVARTSDPRRQERYVRCYESRSADALLEARLRSEVQQRALFLQAQLGIWSVAKHLLNRKLPDPLTRMTLPNRSVRLSFNGELSTRKPLPITRSEIDSVTVKATTSRCREYANAIRKRGGIVVFVRFPSSGSERIEENAAYPRTEEWDLFARNVNTPCLHFEDDLQLVQFVCPDESHLDARDVERFTRILHDSIVAQITRFRVSK